MGIGINIFARIIHETYNHGATGYSVMLQSKCKEQKSAKIHATGIVQKRRRFKKEFKAEGDFRGDHSTQSKRFSRSFF